MKKLFLMFAAFALCVVPSCSTDDNGGGGDNDGPVTSDTELHLPVTVQLKHGAETSNWAYVEVKVDGQKILDFFGLNEEEFLTAMGTIVETDAVNGVTGQKDNTLEFGTYYAPTDTWSWIPRTSGTFGHWFAKNGKSTYFANEEDKPYFYTEWSWEYLEGPEEYEDYLWSIVLGVSPDNYDLNPGDKLYDACEIIYDGETDKVCYIEYTIEIVDYTIPSLSDFTILETKEIEINPEYNTVYASTPLISNAEIATVLGETSIEACTIYGVNADGSLVLPSFDNWFNADGNVCAWGEEGCAVNIQPDDTNYVFCNFPDDELIGGTYKCSVIVTSGTKAYRLNVTATLGEPQQHELNIVGTTAVVAKGLEVAGEEPGVLAWASATLTVENSSAIFEALNVTGWNALKIYGKDAEGNVVLAGDGSDAMWNAEGCLTDDDTACAINIGVWDNAFDFWAGPAAALNAEYTIAVYVVNADYEAYQIDLTVSVAKVAGSDEGEPEETPEPENPVEGE